jgi:sporulation protein YabP
MNEYNKDKIRLPHNLILKDRAELTLSGVTDVDSFDETTIIAYTDYGELTVSGTNLHIISLDVDKGEMSVDGKISSLIYVDQGPKTTGFFSKVFR